MNKGRSLEVGLEKRAGEITNLATCDGDFDKVGVGGDGFGVDFAGVVTEDEADFPGIC